MNELKEKKWCFIADVSHSLSNMTKRPIMTQTQTKSTTTDPFYTARSDFNLSVPNLAEISSNLRVFTFDELKMATKNFCSASKIGEGGFGTVYWGVIQSLKHPFDEIQVAVKFADNPLQGHKEWLTEINVLGVVEHPNLVKLVGYCAEDYERGTLLFLVYEYMHNRSIDYQLSTKSETPLSWTMRLKVAQDTARGLTYLHEEMQIIFRDFKSSNILLDDQWNAKLSDFGVARVVGPLEGGVTHISTKFVGTRTYGAPAYILLGHLTCKSDVWSYGVFLYELITGRRPLDRMRPSDEQKLLEWVRPYVVSNRLQLIVDPRLEGNYPLSSVQKLSVIADHCLCRDPKSRPKMSEVLEKVNQLIGVPSTATTLASPLRVLVPMIPAKCKKVVMGVTACKKGSNDNKNDSQKESFDTQVRVSSSCFPQIRSLSRSSRNLKRTKECCCT